MNPMSEKDRKGTEVNLDGKNILVTGAGSGIGKAIANEYARRGATVILLGRTQSSLESAYDEIVGLGYPEPAIVVADLGEPGSDGYKTIGASIASEFDHLDGIVHNAADLGLLTPLETYEDVLWDHVMQVNLKAPFIVTQQCMPLLSAADYASVVFTAEASGRVPKGYWGAYGISKAGLLHMAKMWAIELAKTRIRVNIVDPGPCRTGLRLLSHPGMRMKSYPPPEAITEIYGRLMTEEVLDHMGELFEAQEWLDPERDDRTAEDLIVPNR